jgi:hypothetical protein
MRHSHRRLAAAAVMLGAVALSISAASAGVIEDTFSKHASGSPVTVDHGEWDKLLAAYIKPGEQGLNRVDYKAFKAEGHARLKAYVARLEAVDVAKLDRPEQFAYWANLYNAKTVDIVLDKYPVASIKDISLGGGLLAAIKGGPWKAKVTKVAGHELSLDDIEHVILRGLFKDPRAHYAVNCASVGCPNLANAAFKGASLESQLEQAAAAYVNSPRGASVTAGRLTASSIYSWFQVDFGASEQGVIEHLKRYAAPELKSKLEGLTSVAHFAYDWSLNDFKG